MSVEKFNVLNLSTISNLNLESKRQIIILRKPSEEDLSSSSKRSKMTRVHNPPPVAVARRNARERNRVKQVNNGFATLRQHIPSAIAATYESGSSRGGNKKLSKVETLRMAVDYIKSLEKLLNISEDSSTSSNNNFEANIEDLSMSQFNVTYTYSKADETRLKKDYLMYEDEENIHPLKMEGMDEEILQESNLPTDLSLLHTLDNTASLSPEVYSEHSLSPVGMEPNDTKSYIPVFNVPNQTILPSFSQIAYERLPQVKAELLSPQTTEDSTSDCQTVCVITRDQDLNSVIWWEQQSS